MQVVGLDPFLVHPVRADPRRIDLEATLHMPARFVNDLTVGVALAMVSRVIVARLTQVGQQRLEESTVGEPPVGEFVARGCDGQLREEREATGGVRECLR